MTSLHQAPKLTLVNFGDVWKAKTPALATHVTVTIVLALGHLGWRNGDGVISSFVTLPKVAKVNTVTCHCCWRYRTNLCQWK
jgi:hypothetical protein